MLAKVPAPVNADELKMDTIKVPGVVALTVRTLPAVTVPSETTGVVTTAADCEQHLIHTREIHATNYIGNIHTPRDQSRALVDHRIVNFAGFVVIRILRRNEFATKLRF